MKAMQFISGALSLCLTLPIWYYLLYQILVRVQATELMFFLFWVYLPVSAFASIVARVAEKKA